jgi:hypothetical protein
MHRVAEDSRVPDSRADPKRCRCGCEAEVRRTFAQGHDQIYLANLRSEVAAGRQTADWALAQASDISPAFVLKVSKSMAAIASHKAQAARKGAVAPAA